MFVSLFILMSVFKTAKKLFNDMNSFFFRVFLKNIFIFSSCLLYKLRPK